jgi:putative membrane protein
MMFWSDHDMSGWGYAGMVIGMVLFWALIIVGIIALIRFSTGATQARSIPQLPPYSESPEQLLAARFARGEIDEAEFQQRLAVLRGATPR